MSMVVVMSTNTIVPERRLTADKEPHGKALAKQLSNDTRTIFRGVFYKHVRRELMLELKQHSSNARPLHYLLIKRHSCLHL
jgi:hypothetical protein